MNDSKLYSNSSFPKDWELITLAKVTKIYDGTHLTPNYVEVGVPFFSVEHVTSDNFLETKFISEEVYNKEGERVFLEKGDILMTRIGDIGSSKYIEWDVKASFYVTLALIKNLGKKRSTKYLNQFIKSNFFQRELHQRTLHVAFPKKINLGDIGECLVAFPPISEQKAVAKVLSTWDKAISKTEALITQKELRKKWLMQNLLTGKKRLKGFDGEWKEIHIRDISKEVSIKNKSDKQLTVLSCTKYDGLVPSLAYFGRKIFADDVSTYKIVPKYHFAYATNHIEEGSIGYQDVFDEALISPMYTVFKTDDSINDYFFFKLLKSYRLNYEFNARMEGSIDRRGGLRWDAFSIIKMHIPSIEEQTAIARVLQAADRELQLLKTKSEKLKEQKKGLMQILLTGKKRLKVS